MAHKWYNNCMTKHNYYKVYSTPRQLKLPLNLEKIIDISDPVYSFSEIVDCIDFTKFFAIKESKTGRPRYNATTMLKIILFSFMENGYLSLRNIEKSCKTDIRYMWLLDGMQPPTFATFGNFIRDELTSSIEDIFLAINSVIFENDSVDLNHTYIDGTKIEANANKYTWVWKKTCIKNRDKVFVKLSELIAEINQTELSLLGLKFETRDEYAIDYLESLIQMYQKIYDINPLLIASGKGHKKTPQQRKYQKLVEFKERLMRYAKSIEICGDKRNSYSKTDPSASFMRVKTDYMGNDQLLPSYNMQMAICDEYIAAVDVKQYASDMECFIPLMDKFKELYGHYPKYPVADAGYGSFNNYIFCQDHGMEKFMKFPMFEKETKDKNYKENPYRAVNFEIDDKGCMRCPAGRSFHFKTKKTIKGNKYGRTEEIYECDNCEGCEHKEKCCPRAKGNRQVQINRELTSMHEEVLNNLCSIQGALLCMNRSIQAEGTYGVIKWDRSYKRVYRRGLESIILEFYLISCGYNLYKYHNKSRRAIKIA